VRIGQGRYAGAEKALRRALPIVEQVAPASEQLVELPDSLGIVLLEQARYDEAARNSTGAGGTGGTSRVMKIGSVAEANAARADLERVVRAWCEWRAPAAKKKK
jgi:hypothetical protein